VSPLTVFDLNIDIIIMASQFLATSNFISQTCVQVTKAITYGSKFPSSNPTCCFTGS